MWTFGSTSPQVFLRKVQDYQLIETTDQITTKDLILDAPHDKFRNGQPRLLADELQCEKFVSMAEF